MNNAEIKTQKQQIRTSIKTCWKNLSSAEQTRYNRLAFERLINHKAFLDAKTILIYAPQSGKELCFTAEVMEYFPKKIFCFPKIEQSELHFFKVERFSDLIQGAFKILSPAEDAIQVDINDVDLAFIPAQSADNDGNRLGRGGGYYDRFLEKNPLKNKKYCVLPDFACLESIPSETFDIKIDYLIAINLTQQENAL